MRSTSADPFSSVADTYADGARLQVVPKRTVSPPDTFYVRHGKRWFDLVASSLLLVLLAVPMALIAVAIRLDSPGRPLFVQKRIGLHGREFTIYKFRTMRHVPHNDLVLLMDEDGELRHKVRNDPRVTRLGRFLRKGSIDELPQLLNVVKGEMSLIGPRPELTQIVATYEPWQYERHAVRPGISGWWQVSGRSDLPMHEHTDLDIYYVEHASVRLDAEIALRTVTGVIRGMGAF